MRVLASLDGTILDPDAPAIRADDLGLMRGDGVFETLLVVDGKTRELGAHLDRLDRSARMLDLPPIDRPAWEDLVATVIGAWTEPGEVAVKLVLTRGPEFGEGVTGFALAMPVGAKARRQRTEGVRVVTLARGFDPAMVEDSPWLLLGAKTLSYAVNQAAIRHAAGVGADDVIFTGADGTVLEGPTSTVVAVTGRTLWTPPPSSGILDGTTQRALFAAAERSGWSTKIEPMTPADLRACDAVFLVSSIRLITRVRELDGEALGGPEGLTAEITEVYESYYA